ncbi:PREDICTED: U1 small nuclear ribonucleoprotein C-like isoform X2 [Nelumbo nucifera]|uniref:U1 small nuclear ribonucleoprotein C n=1 Tax=Nelumbo nucifera TaxID=4432 RepID=A0A1U8ARG2_NELNU|nr:PREDICTED: U1 small nuclear ribonucleoprotein C-like isoform X2 [Nelumbo nucifera]XP_010265588.1 PREDICTED: U1 small nuclear ribonucleoprotein C-like isoform X2 [Nelumbo nucifera]
MPRYYCDYCDTYLTHDSPSVRNQHSAGYKHKANVRSYYQQFEEQQTQSLIDQRIKEHLGQTAAFQQVGAAYNQHLASFQANPQRPRLPILPTPILPTGAPQVPGTSSLVPGIRPPVLPRPVAGAPGYAAAPSMPSVFGPSGTPLPMQVNGLPRPPTINSPTTVPGGTAAPTSNGAPSMVTPVMYQANPTTATSGGFDSFNTTAASGLLRPSPSGNSAPSSTASQDGFTYAQNAEASN